MMSSLVQRWADVKAPAEYTLAEDITCIALSPCGTLCCVGTRRDVMFVFDTTTAELVTQCSCEGQRSGPVDSCVAFSRCGGWIAVGSRNPTVWSTATWECVHTLEGHTGRVRCVAWTHCGRLVSGSTDHTVRVWDVEEGVCTAVLEGHTDYVNGLAVSHTSIFSASEDDTIRVWDVDALSHTHTLTEHTDEVNALALTTDEKQLVSCSDDSTVKVWCTNTLQCLRTIHESAPLTGNRYYRVLPETR